MSFLRRLFGGPTPTQRDTSKPAPSTSPITDWSDAGVQGHRVVIFDPSSQTVRAVGVSEYQGTLERIAGGRTMDGARERDHLAVLIPEPDNPYDVQAIRVVLTQAGDNPRSAHVGYLSRADATLYRPVVERLAAAGLLAACRASITGGWERDGERGTFGVRLSLDTPRRLMGEIDDSGAGADIPPAPPGWDTDRFESLIASLPPTGGRHAGKVVCFTGPSACAAGGRSLSRADQERLAVAVGLTTHPRLTKSVDVLVVADPSRTTGKTLRAVEYGTRVVREREFWEEVGVPLD